MIESTELLKKFIVQCLEEKKTDEITVIDIGRKSLLAEYIICASGRSIKNVRSIAEYIALELKHKAKINTNIEGLNSSEWVLVDAGNILINIFYPETRKHFKLEKMWLEAMEKYCTDNPN